jgi:hypothetical protein
VLHDRRIPGRVANIDHIVIAPGSVYVIDAKHYTGRVERRTSGGFFHAEDRLYVGGRDRSPLVEGMEKQVAAVRVAAGDETNIVPVLCFVNGDWSLFQGPFTVDGTLVTWPRNLARRITESRGGTSQASPLARRLTAKLPPA